MGIRVWVGRIWVSVCGGEWNVARVEMKSGSGLRFWRP